MPNRPPQLNGWLLTAALALMISACDAAPASKHDLILATWNIEHLAAQDDAGCRPRSAADYAELRRHAAALGADIIALQEVEDRTAVARVFDPEVYDIVVSARPEDDLGDCRGQPGQRRTPQRTGFAIHRARLATLGLQWRSMPPLKDLGIAGRRWGTQIRIAPADGNGPAVRLVSLHLKSGCGWGRLDRANVRREQCHLLRRQRGILEAWIDEQAAAGEPFILLGDFNRQLDQPHDDFWRDIDDGSVCDWTPDPKLGRRCRPGTERPDPDADLRLANAGIPFPYPYNPKYPYAIDHLVFDGRSAGWMRRRSYQVYDYGGAEPPPSDHYPIRMAIRLPAIATVR
jgi:endonuclease/exonuclease/phosphatase family metal-dependent hydrolase